MDMRGLPKYPSFSLSTTESSYPLDLPEGLDESHSCVHCTQSQTVGDDQDVRMVHVGDSSEDDILVQGPRLRSEDPDMEDEVGLSSSNVEIAFVPAVEGGPTAQDIANRLINPQLSAGGGSRVVIPQNLVFDVFMFLRNYLTCASRKVIRRAHSISTVGSFGPKKTNKLTRCMSLP